MTSITFMATSRSGLGHLRRVASIATALKALDRRLALDILTNAQVAGLTATDHACFDHLTVVDRTEMAEHATERRADVVVADTMLPPSVERFRGALVLVLRETPPDRLEHFRLPGGRPWDLVLVPNPAEHWLPPLDSAFCHRIEATGWIYRRPRSEWPSARPLPLVLLATGGGGTEETASLLASRAAVIIERARALSSQPFEVVQALGPRAPEGAIVAGVDDVVDPGADLHELFATADAVISTAGYNSVLELAQTTTPTMLMAISRTLDDQAERAERWAPRLGVAYREGATDEAVRWLVGVVEQRSRRPMLDLGPSGAADAARHIAALAR